SNTDKDIFSFLFVNSDNAILQAKKIDEEMGKNLPLLSGIPAIIKDNILVDGMRCTAGSKILEHYQAPYDATAIRKLKDQGVVILGKGNMDEFGMGSSTENSAFGVTKNPIDLTRVAGGSSGGPSAAVASSQAIYALAADTGGSIRQPASFCGVVGLKPTYGAVSRHGLISMASSLDQIGPITKTVEDSQIVFDAISGKDPLDSTSIELQREKQKSEEFKVGVPKEYFVSGMDPEVEKIIKDSIIKLEDHGVKVEEISLPHTEYALSEFTKRNENMSLSVFEILSKKASVSS
ncbi:amidase, partial [Patescibacteria group bacterium]